MIVDNNNSQGIVIAMYSGREPPEQFLMPENTPQNEI
jgi:hypothetical protein